MPRTQIYIPKTQAELLRKEAHKKRSTISGVIRELIHIQMQTQNKRNKKSESLLSAVQKVNKGSKKGPKDLAKRLDNYLYDSR
jgi:hypothetical protein